MLTVLPVLDDYSRGVKIYSERYEAGIGAEGLEIIRTR